MQIHTILSQSLLQVPVLIKSNSLITIQSVHIILHYPRITSFHLNWFEISAVIIGLVILILELTSFGHYYGWTPLKLLLEDFHVLFLLDYCAAVVNQIWVVLYDSLFENELLCIINLSLLRHHADAVQNWWEDGWLIWVVDVVVIWIVIIHIFW